MSLASQDYNNKAPDDELATVPCLDIEAPAMTVGNAKFAVR